ncbi:MAG: biotin--[acetyl-CoA-carboxylase] ligase [Oscillospiraceae bacterium]
MSVKTQLLKMLEEHPGEALSGEKLAQSLGVSRAAVWKAIQALREQGYRIHAATNRGYSLDPNTDVLSAQGIRAGLPPKYQGLPIEVFEEVDSTNSYARLRAVMGAPHGLVVAADSQTAGKGRLGRSFYSPGHTGLYFSVVLHPRCGYGDSLLLTAAAAVSVCESIRELYGYTPAVKWVNDIYWQGKKICGILCEALGDFESGMVESAIVGIGINCTTAQFPEELQGTAGALGPARTGRSRLAAQITAHLLDWQENLLDGRLMEEYRRLNFLLGEPVRYRIGGTWHTGLAVDINERGNLVVKEQSGKLRVLSSGEVSQVRQAQRAPES